MLTLFAAHVRQHRQHLEGQAAFNIAEIDDGIFKVVENKHKQQARTNRKHNACPKNQHGVRQHRLGRHIGGAAYANDFVVRLCFNSRLVFIKNKPFKNAGGNAIFRFKLPETGFRQNNTLLNRGKLIAQVVLLSAKIGELVAHHLQGRTPSKQRTRSGINKPLP